MVCQNVKKASLHIFCPIFLFIKAVIPYSPMMWVGLFMRRVMFIVSILKKKKEKEMNGNIIGYIRHGFLGLL